MQRRSAIKNMVALGGLALLPAWVNGWNKASVLLPQQYLSSPQQETLAQLVETIIPATDTPGAKGLHVDKFVQKMVVDCYENEVKDNFAKGLSKVEEMARENFAATFSACTTAQRISLLSNMEQSDQAEQKEFFRLVKDLAIQGYMTSEYVMTTHTKYTMIPGHYYGCVSVPSK